MYVQTEKDIIQYIFKVHMSVVIKQLETGLLNYYFTKKEQNGCLLLANWLQFESWNFKESQEVLYNYMQL